MDPIALRPRKATEIIDTAIEVYRRNPIHFLLLAAMVRVPWLIVQIVVLAPLGQDIEAAIVPAMLINMGAAITTFIMAGFVIQMTSEIYLGRETDAFASMRKVAGRIPSVFIASVLQTIAIAVALLFFLLPAVWVSAVLFSVLPVVVLERASAFKAFDRSGALSKGIKSHILSALGLVAIIWIVIKIGGALIALVAPTPALQMVITTAVDMIVYPLFGITSTLLYYDARIRKEGFDIEMMAAQAPVASSAPSTTTV